MSSGNLLNDVQINCEICYDLEYYLEQENLKDFLIYKLFLFQYNSFK